MIIAGTSLGDTRTALAEHSIDHALMGAGLDLDVRLEMIRAVFEGE